MPDLLLKNHAPDRRRAGPSGDAGERRLGARRLRAVPASARPGLEASTGGARGVPRPGRRQGAGPRRRARLRRGRQAHGPVRGQEAGRGLRALAQRLSGRGDDRARARDLLRARRRRPRGPADRLGPGRLLRARQGQQHAPRPRHPARDRARPFAARGRGDHARGRLVVLPEPQARHRQPAARVRAAGDLLPPAQSGPGLCLPARLHRRPLAGRDHGGRGRRRRAGAQRATTPAAPPTATTSTT